jgi:hypothetical protein
VAEYIELPQAEEEIFEKQHTDQQGAIKSVQAIKEEAAQQPTAAPGPQAEHFEVSAKAYRVVNHLFHCEGQRRQGSATFTDLGRLMSEAGFEQYPTGGSAYTFLKPSNGTRERKSIVFHAHHGTSTYEGYELRRTGHRLTKNFGWTAGTFSLA